MFRAICFEPCVSFGKGITQESQTSEVLHEEGRSLAGTVIDATIRSHLLSSPPPPQHHSSRSHANAECSSSTVKTSKLSFKLVNNVPEHQSRPETATVPSTILCLSNVYTADGTPPSGVVLWLPRRPQPQPSSGGLTPSSTLRHRTPGTALRAASWQSRCCARCASSTSNRTAMMERYASPCQPPPLPRPFSPHS